MKVITFVVIISLALISLCATPASAQTPPMPHAFYGTVEINNLPADIGTQIEARGEGVLTNVEGNPIVVTDIGQYGGAGPLEPKLIIQGDIAEGTTLTFFVNGVPADQTAQWHAGAVTELNLTITMTLTSPTVTTDVATDIDNTIATLHGVLSNLGDASLVEVSFEWGTTTDYGNETDTQIVTAPASFNTTLSGLAANTSYHFRAKAVGEGTTYGIDRTFTTTGDTTNGNTATEDGASNNTTPMVSDISISPSKVNIGETVNISVLVTNAGSHTASCTITLKINGVEESTKEETLDAGTSKEVTFTTVKNIAGSYLVDVNGLNDSFTVEEAASTSIKWPVIGGVIAAILIIVLLVIILKARRRAYY